MARRDTPSDTTDKQDIGQQNPEQQNPEQHALPLRSGDRLSDGMGDNIGASVGGSIGDSVGTPEQITITRPDTSPPAESSEVALQLRQCEHQIERYQEAELQAARAMRRVTDQRLYTERGFDTVAAYAKAHHGISKQRWYQLVAYAAVYDALKRQKDAIIGALTGHVSGTEEASTEEASTAELIAEESTAVDSPDLFTLPTGEAHTRPLHPYKDDPGLLATLWSTVLAKYGRDLTRKKIASVVREMTASDSDPDTKSVPSESSSAESSPVESSPVESAANAESNGSDDDVASGEETGGFDAARERYAPHLDGVPDGHARGLVSIAAAMASPASAAGEDPTPAQVKAARRQFEAFERRETDFVPASSVGLLTDDAGGPSSDTGSPAPTDPDTSSSDTDPDDSPAQTTSVDPAAVMSSVNGSSADDSSANGAKDTDITDAADTDEATQQTLTDSTLTDALMAVPKSMLTPAMAEVAVPIGVPQAQREAGVPLSFFDDQDGNAEECARDIVKSYLASGTVTGLNTTNENVDWAARTINPITGCLHTCSYCYARSVGEKRYKQGFHPTFFPGRLAAIQDASVSTEIDHVRERNVFVGSMSDVFGQWIPDWMIQMIIDATEEVPELNFLFLTKFPQKLSQFTFPDNAWVGTTVDRQSEVARAEKHLAQVEASVKWLSCEPMLEPLVFEDLSPFDTVVIGAQKAYTGTCEEIQPEFGWVADLCAAAREADCTLYLKENLNLELPKKLPTA